MSWIDTIAWLVDGTRALEGAQPCYRTAQMGERIAHQVRRVTTHGYSRNNPGFNFCLDYLWLKSQN
jgi:hypothetical protein